MIADWSFGCLRAPSQAKYLLPRFHTHALSSPRGGGAIWAEWGLLSLNAALEGALVSHEAIDTVHQPIQDCASPLRRGGWVDAIRENRLPEREAGSPHTHVLTAAGS